MSPWCYIDARNGIEIGEDTWIGPRVALISMNHDLNDYSRYVTEDPIRIGSNCWIGLGATILPGVVLGDRTVVAAGAVVTKSADGHVILAGVPARPIRHLRAEMARDGRASNGSAMEPS